jgi:HlyD family secretion protein
VTSATTPTAARPDDQIRLPDLAKRSRTRRIVMAVVLLAAAGGAALYWTKPEVLGETYRSMPVERRTIVRVVEATGYLDARSRVEVSAPMAGHLASIDVRAGDSVKLGQILARMDDRATSLGVRSAGATLEASVWRVAEARTAYESAVRAKENVDRLLARGLASPQEVQAAQTAIDRARAVLKSADAEKSLAQDNVAVAKFGKNLGDIVAPIEGIVLQAPENVGVSVAAERGALFVLAAPLSQMRIDANVSEADIGDVKVGQQASFEVQTFPGRQFTARVERIGLDPRREGGVVSYPVRLLADNADGALLPGMTAAVRIEIARVTDVLAVREAALRFLPEDEEPAEPGTRLWRHTGLLRVEALAVTAGLSDGVYTEVKPAEGTTLEVGDSVAVGQLKGAAKSGSGPGLSLGGKK